MEYLSDKPAKQRGACFLVVVSVVVVLAFQFAVFLVYSKRDALSQRMCSVLKNVHAWLCPRCSTGGCAPTAAPAGQKGDGVASGVGENAGEGGQTGGDGS